jgi:hypothetical protein
VRPDEAPAPPPRLKDTLDVSLAPAFGPGTAGATMKVTF